jgi:hypothetical protein
MRIPLDRHELLMMRLYPSPVGLSLALALTLSGCVTRDEVARIPSPGTGVDAVLVETNGGATTDFSYDVYLTRHGWPSGKGQLVANLYGAIRSDSAYGANLRWVGSNALAIEFDSVRNTPWVDSTPHFRGMAFRVRLSPGTIDSTAPGGGMMYNLKKHRRTS